MEKPGQDMSAPEVSVVIVCMNRPDNLYPCLESISAHCGVSHEILVVAYLFSEENLSRAKADWPDVHFVESREIRGFSENNNLALKLARGRFCFVLNDDTELRSDVIGRLVGDFARLPENAAIVTPKLVNADGSLQLCGRPPYPSGYYALQQWHLHSEPKDDTVGKRPVFDEVFRTSNISGAAFLIRTDIFREAGWFDERYFFTPEDIALSARLREVGFGVYVDRAAEVVHKWKATASRMSLAVRPAAVRGSLIFFSRGSSLKYFLLALPVWLAEFAKFIKACLRRSLRPSEENAVKMNTFRENCRAVFSRRTPKEIFIDSVKRWKLL